MDKHAYQRGMKNILEKEQLLTLRESAVREILVEEGKVQGLLHARAAFMQAVSLFWP